jgi:hypothetical protein
LKPIVKNAILGVVLTLSFVLTALVSIYVTTQVDSLANHSNLKLEFIIRDVSTKGYTIHPLALKSSNAVALWNEGDFYNTLQEKKPTDVYYEQAHYDFPAGLNYAKVWFTVDDVSYYITVY